MCAVSNQVHYIVVINYSRSKKYKFKIQLLYFKWLKDLAEQTRERSFVRKQQPTSKALGATKDESGKNNSVSTRTGSGKGSESSSADAPDDSLRSPSPLPRPRSAVGAKEAVLV